MALRNLNPFKDNSAEGSGFGGKTDLLLLLQMGMGSMIPGKLRILNYIPIQQ